MYIHVSKELQLKEYAMNIMRNHAPSACQALDRSSARASSHVFLLSHVQLSRFLEIEMSLHQFFKLTTVYIM